MYFLTSGIHGTIYIQRPEEEEEESSSSCSEAIPSSSTITDPGVFHSFDSSGPTTQVTLKNERQVSCRDWKAWRAVKIVHAHHSGQTADRYPHNIRTEVDILRRAEHPNIIRFCVYRYISAYEQWSLSLPLLSFPLSSLLHDPNRLTLATMTHLIKSIIYQLLQALNYLHTILGVAHRDLKPENIMLDWDGTVKVIDFGTACWLSQFEHDTESSVGTGAYRAPELLFGQHEYDRRAIDLWALGAIISEFFAPIAHSARHYQGTDSDSWNSEESDGSGSSPTRSIDPLDGARDRVDEGHTQRATLFDVSFGDVGLAASVFRVRGSPSADTWPGFTSLPDANKIHFDDFPGQSFRDLLPDLQRLGSDAPHMETMLDGFLQLDPERRLSASDALNGVLWNDSILVPTGYEDLVQGRRDTVLVTRLDEKCLADLLAPWIVEAEEGYERRISEKW
ncbi:kinase-like domain-containing protein [Naematelia encephala]|uniref:Kinase-like domain-containing protein n=1 Tax=Naematelia encephala TaxID=71784 RepID=A0A1Y2B9Q7_9TREE|nr:kinase-like domain-containing protein [Naematelia encephala]